MGEERIKDPAVRRVLADCEDAIGTLDFDGRRFVLRRLVASLLPSEEAGEILAGGEKPGGQQKKKRRG